MMFIASVIQMSASDNIARNLEAAERLIGHAKADGANLVVLPENFYFMGRSSKRFDFAENLTKGALQEFFSRAGEKKH
ncbi:nitrilase-related carbon-nitrogen hydrolase, partial [Piscirickettsia litoralis]|uniref:nitrilase-related carbon-nitrogen hydrolase n=1 Tax=Piscirickettsia litoralis TaxID=1891921 RepID=UPI002938D5AB